MNLFKTHKNCDYKGVREQQYVDLIDLLLPAIVLESNEIYSDVITDFSFDKEVKHSTWTHLFVSAGTVSAVCGLGLILLSDEWNRKYRELVYRHFKRWVTDEWYYGSCRRSVYYGLFWADEINGTQTALRNFRVDLSTVIGRWIMKHMLGDFPKTNEEEALAEKLGNKAIRYCDWWDDNHLRQMLIRNQM